MARYFEPISIGGFGMSADGAALGAAMDNLLGHCAGLSAGSRLVVIRERASERFYDPAVAEAVARMAAERDIHTTLCDVPFCEEVSGLDAELADLMAEADCTIFFARLGDQVRFRALPKSTRAIVSYALDLDMLTSAFGTAHFAAFVKLKYAIDAMIETAGEIRVTCPRGTDFIGPGVALGGKQDVSIIRFPMSVFAPVPAAGFAGRAALAGFLVGTGSRYYSPYGRALQRRIIAHFASGRLTGFTGDAHDVRAAEAHYDDISARFDIDRNAVHSWHAGIHPGCAFRSPVDADFLRWSGGAFGNPRLLHFHTCGAYAPGEISWNILDPTVRIDGVAVWEDGRLHPERVPGGAQILADYPCAAAAFAEPESEVGFNTDYIQRIDA